MQFLRILFFVLLVQPLSAQLPVPTNGVSELPSNSFVLTNVKIIVSPEKTIENGNIIVRNGRIEDVGFNLLLPNDLPLIDGVGKVVVPAFIELQSSIGIPVAQNKGWDPFPQLESRKNGPYYWNESVHPEMDPTDLYSIDATAINELTKMGFGLAVVHQDDGIFQGTGTLITLGTTDVKSQLIQPKIAAFYSFKKGVSNQTYPSSQMGSIALMRQAFYDAQYHQSYGKLPNLSLDAINQQSNLPSIFYTNDPYELFRVAAIGHEFKRTFTIIGTGKEYFLGNSIDTLQHHLIVPIAFPEAFELKDPLVARQIPYADLVHWEQAPHNPAFLQQHGIPFTITSQGNKTSEDFWKNIHRAFEYGWTVSDALRALTTTPAKELGISAEYGTIEKGKWACFNVFDVDPFFYDAKLIESVSKGNRTIKQQIPTNDIRGNYSLNINGTKYDLELTGSPSKLDGKVSWQRSGKDPISGTLKTDTLYADVYVQYVENDVVLQFMFKEQTIIEHFQLKGVVNSRVWIFEGMGTNRDGNWVKWSAIRTKSAEHTNEKPVWEINSNYKEKTLTPAMAFGVEKKPISETIIFENATVWTNEAEGILSNATVIVQNGKIKSVLNGASSYTVPAGARVINAQGKHLTTGIIDEHSHIAISKGVNEGGQAVSAEVRIGDVITADDINVYRQLSGGVTAAQLLHGSANPIGGQSALIKLKWGHLPSDYLIPNAPKFVKFALGENVKQANWGDFNTVRFPQTRMGVEQVYIDAFSRAIAYHTAQNAWNKLSEKEKATTPPPAKDLELDALFEIVSGQRHITCHSYIQSEINMLMHVADSFGFQVNTFTHILEGYKVADKMKAHGAGASTFSDWWAYKFEVKDAVPYNASLMHQMGIVVAINSDDAEMGRRLNQEAAKVVKYGGISEQEAWKMVTLNPAILLHLDQQMGSIKVGKDADLVLWTANPLSIEAKVLYTVVDGEVLFDRTADINLQQSIEADRARIIANMLDATQKGAATKPFVKKRKGRFHCNTLGEEQTEEINEH
jgi:imidazolonepropionase-like amidohydrolase